LGAVLRGARLAGSAHAGVVAFAYQLLDWSFTMPRGVTIVLYACSVVLTFLLGRKLMNFAGASADSLVAWRV